MTEHPRKSIREAVKLALVNRTAAADRVFETRLVPFSNLELPAIAVYTLEESVDPESASTAPRELRRDLKLAVEAAVQGTEDVDDVLDALALEIEKALGIDPTFRGTASDSHLAATDIGVQEEGEQVIGILRLTYAATYFTPVPDADDVALDDLDTVDVTTRLGGLADRVEDRITAL